MFQCVCWVGGWEDNQQSLPRFPKSQFPHLSNRDSASVHGVGFVNIKLGFPWRILGIIPVIWGRWAVGYELVQHHSWQWLSIPSNDIATVMIVGGFPLKPGCTECFLVNPKLPRQHRKVGSVASRARLLGLEACPAPSHCATWGQVTSQFCTSGASSLKWSQQHLPHRVVVITKRTIICEVLITARST